jgi:thymidylate kinase
MKIRKNKNFILLFGPDGAGKTTLAKTLAKNFAKKDVRVKVSWMRGTHTLALVMARFLSRFNSLKGQDNPYFHIRSPSPIKLWQLIEFLSVIPVILVKYEVPRRIGYTVIGERSYIDFIVWVATTTNDPLFIRSKYATILLKMASRGKNFYVTAKTSTLLKRRFNEIDKNFLEKQIKYYKILSKIINAVEIDSTQKSLYQCLLEVYRWI